ncbi:NAD(P)-dependent oxidoreductase [Pseudomonas sp. Hp2]|uniref:NAD(P)-dependent oxidoreductase n=1 Tax=Pseudomonas sp. Hp2 TaxID=701189 RepID=UPI00112DD237|nr:NAD(P)H-binding protein [Pseudomonas sp. Hp2]
MKIALIGASGNIGREIARQAVQRGHQVTAVVRPGGTLPGDLAGLPTAIAAVDDAAALAQAIAGHDVLASAYGPRPGAAVESIGAVAGALAEAARKADVRRLVVVGGAGSLEVAPGLQLVDTADFPAPYKPYALAHREALGVLRRQGDLDWTFLSPAAEIGPGPQKGHYRTQAKSLLVDAAGHSTISYADYASAFLDEIEKPQYVRQIATAAY